MEEKKEKDSAAIPIAPSIFAGRYLRDHHYTVGPDNFIWEEPLRAWPKITIFYFGHNSKGILGLPIGSRKMLYRGIGELVFKSDADWTINIWGENNSEHLTKLARDMVYSLKVKIELMLTREDETEAELSA